MCNPYTSYGNENYMRNSRSNCCLGCKGCPICRGMGCSACQGVGYRGIGCRGGGCRGCSSCNTMRENFQDETGKISVGPYGPDDSGKCKPNDYVACKQGDDTYYFCNNSPDPREGADAKTACGKDDPFIFDCSGVPGGFENMNPKARLCPAEMLSKSRELYDAQSPPKKSDPWIMIVGIFLICIVMLAIAISLYTKLR